MSSSSGSTTSTTPRTESNPSSEAGRRLAARHVVERVQQPVERGAIMRNVPAASARLPKARPNRRRARPARRSRRRADLDRVETTGVRSRKSSPLELTVFNSHENRQGPSAPWRGRNQSCWRRSSDDRSLCCRRGGARGDGRETRYWGLPVAGSFWRGQIQTYRARDQRRAFGSVERPWPARPLRAPVSALAYPSALGERRRASRLARQRLGGQLIGARRKTGSAARAFCSARARGETG